MRIRLQPWQLAAIFVVLCCAVVGIVRWQRETVVWDTTRMVAALPTERATVFYADVSALRKAGILDQLVGSKTSEEADYRKFVEQIGFDYRTDLDALAGALINNDSYFAVRGRFQWSQLANYARTQGGECHYAVCSLPTSTVGRKISFYPLHKDVLAFAVTSDHSSVEAIAPGSPAAVGTLPPEPIWITIPSLVLTKSESLPPSVRKLLDPVTRAEKVTIAMGTEGSHALLRLSVACKTPDEAETVRTELYSATSVLRSAALAETSTLGQPDWAGVLRGGTFVRDEAVVTGKWPLEQSFLEALFSSETR